ncbi:Alpha/beta hydrolase family protein [Brevundimonas sp. SH203]|uniref:alpha/beta hydrolase family protein n=1 Tax=Brevundimonas sp. SH203 TaxID=345167 RepID=UPI0009C95CD1|nr:alpha/beta hydrolase [Brevundimonas sp. SH203]GAW40693.1 Alpha/beta hydrolase family protein [Brevundimonas sp. SH203]
MAVGVEDWMIEARDGWPLAATLFRPDSPRMAVLMSAGTGFPRGFYGRFARWMAERGAVVLTYDYRGIGGSRPDDLAAMRMDYPDWGRLDMPAALEALKAAAPGLPVFHVGHSVGGHFVGFMPNQAEVDRHAFVSVGTGWWGGHHRSYNPFELFFWLVLGPGDIRRHGYVRSGRLWRGTDLPRGVFQTWKRWCLKPSYFLTELADGRLEPQQFDRVTAPIRSWIFSDDPIATPGTGRRLLDAYRAAPAEIRRRAPRDYGVKRIGHEGAFRKGLEPLWEEILEWFEAGLSAARPSA